MSNKCVVYQVSRLITTISYGCVNHLYVRYSNDHSSIFTAQSNLSFTGHFRPAVHGSLDDKQPNNWFDRSIQIQV